MGGWGDGGRSGENGGTENRGRVGSKWESSRGCREEVEEGTGG